MSWKLWLAGFVILGLVVILDLAYGTFGGRDLYRIVLMVFSATFGLKAWRQRLSNRVDR